MTIQQLRRQIVPLVEDIAATLPPDGDWLPVLFLFDHADRLTILGMDGFTSERGREALLDQLPELLDEQRSARLAFVATVVTHTFKPGSVPERGPAELVQLLLACDDEFEVWRAPIQRRADAAPILGAFSQREAALESDSWLGRFAETARRALFTARADLPEPEPEQDGPLYTIKSGLEAYGMRFTGAAQLAMIRIERPINEVVFAAAVRPELFRASEGVGTGLELALADTGRFGHILRATLRFHQRDADPFVLVVLLNPARDAAWEMISQLATQETTQVVFVDRRDGSDVGRRVLALDEQTRQLLRTVAEMHLPPNPAWPLAVEAAEAQGFSDEASDPFA